MHIGVYNTRMSKIYDSSITEAKRRELRVPSSWGSVLTHTVMEHGRWTVTLATTQTGQEHKLISQQKRQKGITACIHLIQN